MDGLILSSGYTVDIGGSGEYILAGGYNTAVAGSAARDAFIAGYSCVISGNVERDVYVAGNDVVFSGVAGRNLYAAGRSVTITGEVAGDVYIDAEQITLGSDVVIGGTLRYNSSANVTTADSSAISATEIYESSSSEEETPIVEETIDSPWSRILSYLGLVALCFVLLWLTPLWESVDERYTGKSFGKYASAFGIGFGVLAGLPIAAILLMITVVGLRLAFVLIMLYVAVLLVSPIFLGFFLGSLIWRNLAKQAPCYWAELPIGMLVWSLAILVPGVSFAAHLVAAPLALGIITLMLGKKKTVAAAEPVALPEAAEDIPQE